MVGAFGFGLMGKTATVAHQLPLATIGEKLPRSSPYRNRPAIHSASFTSVFRPGTALMCWAFITSNVKSKASKRL